ncbi:MAG: hypothetical protein ACYDCC_00035 [Actinomycetota bacterium]
MLKVPFHRRSSQTLVWILTSFVALAQIVWLPAGAIAKTRVVHTDPASIFPKQDQMRRASSSSPPAPACSASHPVGYQMLYAHPNDVASRFGSLQSAFLSDAASAADRMINDSKPAPVRPRFYCGITDVTMPQASSAYGSDPLSAIMNDLGSLGYNQTTRKYVVWWDGTPPQNVCGQGTFSDDNSPDPSTNQNNVGPDYAIVYKDPSNNSFCGWTTVLHEMGHTLGAVMRGAPHQTANWHCTDQQDIMCYVDGPGVVMTQTCPGSYQYFDCNHDDYFSASPAPGSYLATHWNTYNSSFLESAASQSSPTPAPAPSPTISQPPAAAPAAPSLNSPSSAFSWGQSISLSWSGSASSYVVRYRSATPWSWFGGYRSWSQQAQSATVAGAPGSTYCFSVQSVGPTGAQSSWSSERCTSVPLDDRSASSYRFLRSSGSAFYEGTVSIARSSGATLTWSNINAKQLNVTVQMCSTCTYLNALWNGRTVKRMYLHSSSSHLVQVFLTAFSQDTHGTLVLVVRSPNIVIDSLGASQA